MRRTVEPSSPGDLSAGPACRGARRRGTARRLRLLIAAGTLLAAACGRAGASAPPAGTGTAPAPGKPSTAVTAQGRTVNVLYAGSLVDMMEHGFGAAFEQVSGDRFRGFAGGSTALAHQIQGRLRRADVFISASPAADRALMGTANGGWVSWYATFAEAPLVIGYNPASRFAAQLKSRPWYAVMAEPGFRLGRTDPKLDPKGKLTVDLVQRAAAFYQQPNLVASVLGGAENPAQVFPEEDLVGRLQSGQLDAGFFYSNEAAEAHIPTVSLPASIDPKASYTVTVVRGAPDPQGALRFVEFLLGAAGQAILKGHGLTVLHPVVSGDAAAVPAALRPLLGPGGGQAH